MEHHGIKQLLLGFFFIKTTDNDGKIIRYQPTCTGKLFAEAVGGFKIGDIHRGRWLSHGQQRTGSVPAIGPGIVIAKLLKIICLIGMGMKELNGVMSEMLLVKIPESLLKLQMLGLLV